MWPFPLQVVIEASGEESRSQAKSVQRSWKGWGWMTNSGLVGESKLRLSQERFKLTPSLPLRPSLTFFACRMGEGSEGKHLQDPCVIREGDLFILRVQGLRMCLVSLGAEWEPILWHIA